MAAGKAKFVEHVSPAPSRPPAAAAPAAPEADPEAAKAEAAALMQAAFKEGEAMAAAEEKAEAAKVMQAAFAHAEDVATAEADAEAAKVQAAAADAAAAEEHAAAPRPESPMSVKIGSERGEVVVQIEEQDPTNLTIDVSDSETNVKIAVQ